MQPQRLNEIETIWPLVQQAHCQKDEASAAQEQLLSVYGGAARRYLWGALHDQQAADDVFQDFVVRLLQGDFRSANAGRGRFRNYLKSVLYRMVADYHRLRQRSVRQTLEAATEPAAISPPVDDDEPLLRSRRDELLSRAWVALQAVEQQTGKPLHATLRLRVDNPELQSPELAKLLSKTLHKPISTANVRVMLHRAREKFADFLLEAVTESLGKPSVDRLEAELADLELLAYCRSALKRYCERQA